MYGKKVNLTLQQIQAKLKKNVPSGLNVTTNLFPLPSNTFKNKLQQTTNKVIITSFSYHPVLIDTLKHQQNIMRISILGLCCMMAANLY